MVYSKNIFVISKLEEKICEFHHISFPTWKIYYKNDQDYNIRNSISYLQFRKYSRWLISSPDAQIGWLHIVNELLNLKAFYGSVNFENKWVYGNKNLYNKKVLQEKIRLLNNSSFENFKNQSNLDIFNQLIGLSKKQIWINKTKDFKNVFEISSFQRINIANSIIKFVSKYNKNRLQVFTKIFKELTSKFFNANEINDKYLNSLSNELNQALNGPLSFVNDLPILWETVSNVIEKEINMENGCDEYALLKQLKINNRKINDVKYDLKYGYKTYYTISFLKQIKSNIKKIEKNFTINYLYSKKLVKNWKRGLLHDVFYLRLKSFLSLKDKKKLVFYKINLYKTTNLITFSNYLKKFTYLDHSEISSIITEAKKIVEEYYQNFYFSLKKATSYNENSINLQDIYSQYEKKWSKNIFYESSKIHFFILELLFKNLRKISEYIEKQALQEYQYLKNKTFFKFLKKNSDQASFTFPAFNETNRFKSSLLFVQNEYRKVLKNLIRHYEKIELKTKNLSNFYFIKAQLFYLNLLSKEINSLDKYLNNFSWNNSIQHWTLFLTLITKTYFSHSETKIKDFLWNQKNELVDFILYEPIQSSSITKNLYKFLSLNKPDFAIDKIKKFFSKTKISDNVYLKNDFSFENLSKNFLIDKLQLLKKTQYHIKQSIRLYYLKYLKNWKTNKLIRSKEIDSLVRNLKKFNKSGKRLLNEINLVNKAILRLNWDQSKCLNFNSISKLINSNNYILSFFNELIHYFSNPKKHLFKKQKSKKVFFNYWTTKFLINSFKNVNLDLLTIFSNYNKLDNLSFLKLYLIYEFLHKPSLLIINNFSINDQNSYNVFKGLLLKEQNKEGFACVFLDKDKLSMDLKTKSI